MKKLFYSFIKIALIFIPFLLHGQDKSIILKYDTIRLDINDSIIYQKGNEFIGELKYTAGYGSVYIIIDSGYIKKYTSLSPDGTKAVEQNFKNGKLNGPYLEWNENGILILSGHYLDNYEDSIWTFYYNNGIKETEGLFLPDTSNLIENFTIRHIQINLNPPFDKRDWTTSSNHSPPHGKWNFFNKNGLVIKTIEFDKGVLKSIEVGDHWNE